MGKYDNNPIIEGRYDAYGRQTYWAMGHKGKGIKVAVIDEFSIPHGHQMASIKCYIAPECELIKLNMVSNATYAIRDMLYEAIRQGVNIVSISRGAETDMPDLHAAVIAAKNAGILIFCSAGNDGDKYGDWIDIKQYPAAYDEVVSVLAIDNTFGASSFSSHGTTGDITGFGQNVLVKNEDGSEQLVSGTSPTTPACAFTAALQWSKVLAETGKHPTYEYMKTFIEANTVDLGAVGRDNMTGIGFFTLDRAEYERVKMDILDSDKNGMTQRVDEIKALMASGVSYEQANAQVNMQYIIIGYQVINGVQVPIFGGKKPW